MIGEENINEREDGLLQLLAFLLHEESLVAVGMKSTYLNLFLRNGQYHFHTHFKGGEKAMVVIKKEYSKWDVFSSYA